MLHVTQKVLAMERPILAKNVRIVLGSQSPRRRELLAALVPDSQWHVFPPTVDDGSEQYDFSDWPPLEQQLREIVRRKAADVREQLIRTNAVTEPGPNCVVCADTVVVVSDTHGAADRPWPSRAAGHQLWTRLPSDAATPAAPTATSVAADFDTPSWVIGQHDTHLRILGKPECTESGKAELKRWFRQYYCGREHIVATAMRIERCDAGRCSGIIESVTRSVVKMVADPDPWLEWYVRTDEPYDKAGGYAIQGLAGIFIEACVGSLSNVVGLPLRTVLESLSRLGVLWSAPDHGGGLSPRPSGSPAGE